MNSLLALAFYWWILIGVVSILLIALLVVVFILVPMNTWFRALMSGAHISMFRLVGMKLRKVDYKKIVNQYILARKAGIKIYDSEIETHMMAGGNVEQVIDALIAAHSAKLDLSIEQAMAIDLAGRDVVLAVQTSVKPRVIKTDRISAIAKDGIEVKVIAQVTIKAKLDRIIGGADEATILARVGESVVASVGQGPTHSAIMANPSLISKGMNPRDIEKGSAFEIMSIDICDIDVGENIGSKLRIDEAEAKKRISQAAAEERKAQAIAHEQEMKAKTQEMKAVVLAAESKVHEAMAEALKKGKVGVMDYYKMQNVQADTNMRNSFSNNKENKPDRPERPDHRGGMI
ncbi:MAG: flotillin-like protein FloA [Clostridia bacterium]|nr:flotillin-like protein FloA [Clostridia bacterium]